jgi:PleD family two-component response regulator
VNESKSLKLLVVEDDLEDEELLCQALIEIEENRQWCNWRTASIVHVQQLSDALDCLRREWFDAILLNLSLPDSPALLDSFLEVNSSARGTPIVVLADQDDENLANRLLREGAQDVFLKPELECAPLARSIRYAIERQRTSKALRCSPFFDDLTGTLTRQGFLTIAQHYRRLAPHGDANLILAIIQFEDFQARTAEDRDLRELLLIRAGEVLRAMIPEPAVIGRLERWRFGLMTAGITGDRVVELLNQVVAQLEDAARNGPRQIATICFSSFELQPEDNIEELLDNYGPERLPLPAGSETVMLAD